jgi:hypothetical protein
MGFQVLKAGTKKEYYFLKCLATDSGNNLPTSWNNSPKRRHLLPDNTIPFPRFSIQVVVIGLISACSLVCVQKYFGDIYCLFREVVSYMPSRKVVNTPPPRNTRCHNP